MQLTFYVPQHAALTHSLSDLSVTYGPSSTPAEQHTRIGALRDLEPLQDMPTNEDIHYWTHGDDEEDEKDEATARALLYTEDPQEAVKQRLHCGRAYVEEILDD